MLPGRRRRRRPGVGYGPLPVGPETVWEALEPPWQAAFEEAWSSWRSSCFGIGAVVVDGRGEIVSRGRNRITEQRRQPAVLAGSAMAHAEMNALAALPLGSYEGHSLYTTLEPCLMCASTIVLLRLPAVHFAAADPMFEGTHEHLAELAFCADRVPARTGPLEGPVAAFAALLPLSFIAFWARGDDVFGHYEARTPALAALAERVVAEDRLAPVANAGGGVPAALAAVWDDLGAVGT
jgi:tRNA(adenine34) deaminase